MKYGPEERAASLLAAMMAAGLPPPQVAAITFVPMWQARQRQRGFNQAELLARSLANHWQLSVWDGLQVVHATQKRQASTTNKQERQQNIKDVFCLKPEYQVPNSLLIVDDVLTTGSTANEISRVLKVAGCSWVEVLVAAHGDA